MAIEIVMDKIITRSRVLTNGDMELIINLGGLDLLLLVCQKV
jgi:hypothetical protein